MARETSYERKYTRPKLREQIKEELKQSDRGGRRGQWSARKSQLLVKEYERRGGGYRDEANREAATSLHEWTEQEWQTAGGDASAEHRGRMQRYLPKEVWERLTPKQREQAQRSKREAERRGERRAKWPAAVARVMRQVEEEGRGQAETKARLYIRAKELDVRGRSRMSKAELRRAVRRAERDRG